MSETTDVAKRNGAAASRQEALRPPVDIFEDESGITLLADLPGVTREKLSISVDSDNLTIEADVVINLPPGAAASYAEIQVPRYQRTFKLSRELEGSKASAELKNGVLTLRIPKAAHAQPRKIEIQAA